MLLRGILIAHRYLAVAVGLLMTLWCLSGFVMMYQSYPGLTQSERLRGLAPLDLSACCNTTALDAMPDEADAPDVRIEMLLGDPVLRMAPSFGRREPTLVETFNLRTGLPLEPLTAAQVVDVARAYAQGHGIDGEPRILGAVEVDQWTIQTARRNQPAYRLAFDDAAGTQLYVSGRSGEAFQDTNRRERMLTWLGAIPHWLYPTQLRRNGPLWSEIVIWTSVIGTFLTITGLYVGIARLRRRADGRWSSPFRGWWYWHHISGLIFGVLALTWVFSGLMTMNPWGTLVGTGASTQIGTMRGNGTWGELQQFLTAVGTRFDRGAYRQLSSAPFDHRLYVIATGADGNRARLDATATPALLRQTDIDAAVARLGTPVLESSLLVTEDSYYYRHKNEVELPVYRILLDDAERTRLYIQPVTGSMRGLDSASRAARWIRFGLHDLDFTGLRTRPIWDIVVILLLLGVTGVCITGTWMALKRVRRDCHRLVTPHRAKLSQWSQDLARRARQDAPNR